MNPFAKLNEAYESAEAALKAVARATRLLVDLTKRLDVIEERLKALEDAINDGESMKLKAEKDYIDGMYNMLNYDISMAKKPKGGILNE